MMFYAPLVVLVFISWLLINYLGYDSQQLSITPRIVIPCLWAALFIYLYRVNQLYTAIIGYTFFSLLLIADRLNFGYIYIWVQTAYLWPSATLIFSIIFINQVLSEKLPRTSVILSLSITVLAFTLPIFYTIYSVNFNSVVSKEVIYAILQTNFNESIEFIKEFISSIWLIFVSILFPFITFLLLQHRKNKTIKIKISLITLSIIFFSTLTVTNANNIRLYNYAKVTTNEYWKEFSLFSETQEKLKNKKINFEAIKNETGETYIVVIGESLNKRHMGLYGYARDTTPQLNKIAKNDNLLIFDNAFASHTHTMKVLSQALTEANQVNKKGYYNSLSIINILNKANFDTFWITNQNLYGVWDNLVSVIAHQTNQLIALNHSIGKQTSTQVHDGELIREVNNALSVSNKKNKVIFVHLMGSHTIYCSRFPNEFKHYSEELTPAEFGNLSRRKNLTKPINCYDNSVIYNDHVISSLIKSLDKVSGVNGLLYLSDHADDVLKQLGHNFSKFTYAMTQIPLIMWFSDDYKSRYPDKYDVMTNNKNKLFSNDKLYDTVLGILNIQTAKFKQVNDLSSTHYSLKENDAYTLHGKVAYTDKTNHLFQQKNNALKLKKHNLEAKVIPHRINSIGKLRDILSNNYQSFEVDVFFSQGKRNQFQVGHDKKTMSGISLENFLSSANRTINKIWIDFKNLTPSNYKMALDRLNYLDDKFSLRNKTIIETTATKSFFKEFNKLGWHTSYYLPTTKVLSLTESKTVSQLKTLAKNISKQSIMQNLTAISFDQRLYPFVKEFLEPLIPQEIVYHTWDLSKRLYDKEILTKLNKQHYFSDDKVKTVLVHYKSPFHL
jgi:heptose-I-phosphate ethanolaminephosphotransferase